ncbi:SpoIIE family protein phosphatase [Nocardioides dongkuii]|uniref:SpoIIE family protein phosphatase n=1 Tax=Nocardioides dongkuii TaxID=2760089 RepID=UPI0015F9A80E|nr:SpoIIE family protein phosphatase [Nocardioides dongkuii]
MSADEELRAQLDDLLGMDTDTESVLRAFEQAPSLLAVCEGVDLVLTALNAAAREVYGDRLGVPLREALGPLGEDIATWTEEAYGSGTPVEGRLWRIPGPRGDDAVDVRWLRFSLVPARGPDGAVCGVISLAVDVTDEVRARADAERQAADLQRRLAAASDNLVSLQDALLPESLPIAPGLRLAARYLLAEDGARAGGDWFDAVALEDGRVVLTVGDVVGHGVRASVVMGELRTLFEERVRLDGDIVAALEVLERRASRVPQARAATVCAAVLDPADGSFEYCTAGHPPPLVVSPTGDASYLPVTGAGALGSGMPFRSQRHVLAEGDLVLLYSDGLVERPGRSAVQNTLDLSRVAAEVVRAAADADEPAAAAVARETVARLIRETGFGDDITVLAAQRATPPDPLTMTVPAFPDTLRAVRQNLGDWLAGIGVGQLDELALQHAVGELVSNAVEHAYEPDRARQEAVVSVRAALLAGGVVEIEVSDRGTWRPPGPAGTRGRGLAMASGFSDDLHVVHGEQGTRAVLRQRPTTAVDLLTGATIGGATGPDEPMGMRQEDGLVELSGALDQRCADELRRRLSHATRGGIIDVVVDLTTVTFLGSAAVQVLFDAMLTGREGERPALTLVAPPGSAAQHVLEVVRLPYAVERGSTPRA